jgi:hypothetical protein
MNRLDRVAAGWDVKDVLAHIWAWDRVIGRSEHQVPGRPSPRCATPDLSTSLSSAAWTRSRLKLHNHVAEPLPRSTPPYDRLWTGSNVTTYSSLGGFSSTKVEPPVSVTRPISEPDLLIEVGRALKLAPGKCWGLDPVVDLWPLLPLCDRARRRFWLLSSGCRTGCR